MNQRRCNNIGAEALNFYVINTLRFDWSLGLEADMVAMAGLNYRATSWEPIFSNRMRICALRVTVDDGEVFSAAHAPVDIRL